MAEQLKAKQQRLPSSIKQLNEYYQPNIYYCPYCGNALQEDKSFVLEYWNSEQDIYFCWCHECGWRGEITKVLKVTTTEIDE
ncbi:hypothetical protein [Halalkalibacterium ligniniphilum]|uniref:hypothetical protein n=1 Tax=Halalkalibacterium ligniniphilum TaxID=1134413 RepID=UPI00034CEAF6|nr:hypothetical protein [Halalkalibacterium ligniniphilum]